jgi:hypothetical protein
LAIEDPKHMDVGSRNRRLRETLEGMGLYVLPIYSESDPSRIDYLHVSAGLPTYPSKSLAEPAASSSIVAPVPGTQVTQDVPAPESQLNNVVDFPSVLR